MAESISFDYESDRYSSFCSATYVLKYTIFHNNHHKIQSHRVVFLGKLSLVILKQFVIECANSSLLFSSFVLIYFNCDGCLKIYFWILSDCWLMAVNRSFEYIYIFNTKHINEGRRKINTNLKQFFIPKIWDVLMI